MKSHTKEYMLVNFLVVIYINISIEEVARTNDYQEKPTAFRWNDFIS